MTKSIIVIHPDNASLERITAYSNALIRYLKRNADSIHSTEVTACISNVNARSGIYTTFKNGQRGRPQIVYTGRFHEDCAMPHIHMICTSDNMTMLDRLVRTHATNYFEGDVDVRRIHAEDWWSKELIYIKKQTIRKRHLVVL